MKKRKTVEMTMGSLFSGIGGFELSAQWHGVKVIWQSEIEPWACEILKAHFPDAIQLGDIQNIDGALIPPVDIITFGSPCQDMSVAGKRAGLAGAQSGLFMEAVRIIREMRKATNGKYPEFAVWENVPGAFSSNKGHDFQAVLEEITEGEIPMPKSGRWATAGMVRGGTADVSWRVLDAQYWGVPQRRKRVYLVADYRGQRSAEILFKPEGVSRYSTPCNESWEETAADIRTSIKEAVRTILNDQGGSQRNVEQTDRSPTLRAQTHGHLPVVVYGICSQNSNSMKSDNPYSGIYNGGYSLNYQNPVLMPIYAIDRAAYNQGKNARFDISIKADDVIQTVVAKGPNAVAIPIFSFYPQMKAESQCFIENIANTVVNGTNPGFQNGVAIPLIIFQGQASQSAGLSESSKRSPAIQVRKQADICCPMFFMQGELTYIVRRLTPSECAKLQGFPADWHEGIANEKRKILPDTAAYKGYGNAVATVCAEYVLANIADELRKSNREGGGDNDENAF